MESARFILQDLQTEVPSFCIVDTYELKEDSGQFFSRKEFFPTLKNFLSDDWGDIGFWKDHISSIIEVIESVCKLPIPDILVSEDMRCLNIFREKQDVNQLFYENLLWMYRFGIWVTKDLKPYVFVPGEGCQWIDIFVNASLERDFLQPNKMRSLHQARTAIDSYFVKGWIDDFERLMLLSTVNNLDHMPEEVPADKVNQN